MRFAFFIVFSTILYKLSDQRLKEHHVIVDMHKFGFPEIRMVGRSSSRMARHRLNAHRHSGAMEICYLATGRQTFCIQERPYSMTGGQVFLTQPDELHGTGNNPMEKGLLYWVIIDLSPGETFIGLGPPFANELREALRCISCRLFHAGDEIKLHLDAMFFWAKSSSQYRSLWLQQHATGFLKAVIQGSNREDVSVANRFAPLLDHIEQELHEPLDVPRLARFARLSESRFKVLFKRAVGIPPAEYVARQRIERSKYHLRSSNDSITEIALKLGFSSSQYYSTTFRRYSGVTPRQYRKTLG